MTDPFDSYYGLFVAAGRELCEADKINACREWISRSLEEQRELYRDAQRLAKTTPPDRLPLPYNHIRSGVRKASPRTLPAPVGDRQAEYERLRGAETPAIDAAIATLATMPYFPSEPSVRVAVAQLLARMCPSDEAVAWLAQTMVDHVGEWKGPQVLRAVLCQRYEPLDGIRLDLPPLLAEQIRSSIPERKL